MPKGFMKVRFHAETRGEPEGREVAIRGLARGASDEARAGAGRSTTFHDDEAAARYYLGKVLERDSRSPVRGLSAPDRPERVPELSLEGVQSQPLTGTRQVRFTQTRSAIPVFGSRIVVELDEQRRLLDLGCDVADIRGISPVATLSPAQALARLAELTRVEKEALAGTDPPELNFYYHEDDESWHLAWFFRKVPAAPEEFLAAAEDHRSHGHGRGLSPRQRHPRINYLIDAHDGALLLYYSATPLMNGPDMPVQSYGVDDLGTRHEFWVRQSPSGFELSDPLRFLKTYDHKYQDLETDPLPTKPVRHTQADWLEVNRAAVSAHVNAMRVFDFFNGVLMRDGIDGKGMDLVSIVNCTYAYDQPPPEWNNAVWYDNRMYYGQSKDGNGELRSYARFLDVIAHELTHGVTEHTANLVYKNQSGALDESFSDIFGIIIKNWYEVGPDSDVARWNWELGSGLGEGGLPLRDFSDPARTGDPAHMDDYDSTPFDSGGVHTNSNIHNQAAYRLLTIRDAQGRRAFTPREVALLYYLCLTRLTPLADFSDALESLVAVAGVYYGGDANKRDSKVASIRKAYKEVGIQ